VRITRQQPADIWLSVQVELIEGRGQHFWPRPGRVFAASARQSFALLADAIDSSFARWDRSHLHEFELSDGTRIGMLDPEADVDDEVLDERVVQLSRLNPGEQFVYVFDFGDDWAHLCTVGKAVIDSPDFASTVRQRPVPSSGWGAMPDQYGREWSGDDGETPLPPDPKLADLPPIRPGWGRRRPD
jgi:hypothetical protein